MQAIIPYRTDGGIAKLSCNGVSLTRDGKWVLPIWREIGGGAPCQQVSKSTKALHGVASVLISGDQVHLAWPCSVWGDRDLADVCGEGVHARGGKQASAEIWPRTVFCIGPPVPC